MKAKTGPANPNWRGGLEAKTCERCSSAFTIAPSAAAVGYGRFCSDVCRNATLVGPGHPLWEGGKATPSPNRAANTRRYRERNPEKDKARSKVHKAIRTGKLVRSACEGCGEKKVQAHHEDYSKPLEVRWLCIACHRKEHAETKRPGQREVGRA
jgi:ribosomal protein S27AE